MAPAVGGCGGSHPVAVSEMTGNRALPGLRRSPAVSLAETRRPDGNRLFLAVVPYLVMAAVALVDILAGPGVGFLPVLSLGPALAAVSRRAAQTALIGGLALILWVSLAMYDHLAGSQRGVIALVTILGVTAAGVAASAGRQRRERELADIRAVAEVAQQVLLRPVPVQAPPVQIAVRYISAAASARIGGDLYEVMTTGSWVRLIVGDVQGNGLPAVRTAAVVLGAFREAAYDARDLTEIAARIELSLARRAAEEEFVTAVLAQIAERGTQIEILNCGHPPPLLVRGAEIALAEPPEASLPLGLASLAVSARKAYAFPFGPGDRMLFYTDGISEARDKAGAFYPLARCGALLDGQDLDSALDRLRDDVVQHVGHALLDDAAMLLIRNEPGEPRDSAGRASDMATMADST